MLPKITIVTPSYNQGQYIEDTILSILNQEYPSLEYIIIDGGSSDNTVDIIKKYSDRITYWISEKDDGQSDAINKGFKKATGDILNWINSDDQLMPGALQKIADHFADNPEAFMVHGRIEYFGETEFNFLSGSQPVKDKQQYAAHICMPQPATFYRRKLLEEQGLLDESLQFSMDTDLFIRAGLNYQIVQVEDVLARFRLHAMSKSVSGFNKKFLVENAIIFGRVLATLDDKKTIEEFKSLGFYTPPAYLYKKPVKRFDSRALLFYFLLHRLYTLHHQGDKKEFRRIFRYLVSGYPGKTLSSGKLLLYRLSLFLPAGFLQQLSRKRNKRKT